MSTAKGTFHIFDATQGRSLQINAGDPIPDHLVDKVGKHLGGTAGGAKTTVNPGATAPVEGSPEFESALDEAFKRGVASAQEAETQARGADGYGTFDPASENAPEVHAYLSGLDRETYAGSSEFERVTEAEKAAHNNGKGRTTALVAID